MTAMPKQKSLEHSPHSERLLALFGGARCNGYAPAMGMPDDKGKVLPVAVHKWVKPPTVELWNQHLAGKSGIGILPPDANNRVIFGVADVDDYQINHMEIAGKLDAMCLPLVPCLSKSGGLHLYLFAVEPVEPEVMSRALVALAARLGFRPKSAGGTADIITTANVWMPFFGGDGSSRSGIKKTGARMTVAEFVQIAEAARQSSNRIAALAKPSKPRLVEVNAAEDPEGPQRADRKLTRHCDDLASMIDGEGRNKTLFIALKEMGSMVQAGWISQGCVEDALRDAAGRCGMDGTKVDAMIRRKNGPLAQGRRAAPTEDGDYPRILRVRKWLTDPVTYTIDVEGGTLEHLSATDWLRYENFNRITYERLNLRFLEMKRDAWNLVVRSVRVEDVEAPAEMGNDGRFFELIEDFLTNRYRGERMEDVLRGRPHLSEAEGCYVFRLSDIDRFIKREDAALSRNISREWMSTHIRKIGGWDKVRKIGGRATRTWSLPLDAVQAMPVLSTPAPKEPGI